MLDGFTFDKLLIVAVIAAFVIGPSRLPAVARELGKFVRRVRDFGDAARERVRSELGDDAPDLEWRQLDPRQYDPRRIIREALLDDAATIAADRPAADAPLRGGRVEGSPSSVTGSEPTPAPDPAPTRIHTVGTPQSR